MPIRLIVVLVVSCLVPVAAECASPFVESRQGPDRDVSSDVARLVGTRECYVRRHFMEPLALPIIDDGPRPVWGYPYGNNPPPAKQAGWANEMDPPFFYTKSDPDLWDLPILRPAAFPSVPLSSRRLNLHLDTAGINRWATALIEVWPTRDGWTWHLYQNAPHGDSLLVALPGEGRYGLRVVVHDANGHASPTPRVGEAPQLWVEVDERLASLGGFGFRSQGDGPWIEGNQFSGLLHYFGEFDQPGDMKQAKQCGLHHPCGYIKRVETEKVCIPQPYAPGYRAFTF